ncbi:hypothetical protein GCM10028805_03640 [Spirosoma harenae]
MSNKTNIHTFIIVHLNTHTFMQYQLVISSIPQDLIRNINEMLSQGWVVQGGISTVQDMNGTLVYAQAMVKPR